MAIPVSASKDRGKSPLFFEPAGLIARAGSFVSGVRLPYKDPEANAAYQVEYRKRKQTRSAEALAAAAKYQHKRRGEIPDRCETCGGRLVKSGRRMDSAAWDHHHGTGKFRGWLCAGCNRALGLAGDNPKILRVLAEYLENKGCSPTRPLIR